MIAAPLHLEPEQQRAEFEPVSPATTQPALSPQPTHGFYPRYVKRILDLLFALLVAPLVLLLIGVLALFIIAEDRGPIIYRAQRMGWRGQPFIMYKLRTMRPNAPDLRMPDGSAYSAAADPRQTRVGRRLRRSSLDELPQILNIIQGQMSFIGPRPDDLTEAGLYRPEDRPKLLVRPGISGYAQVLGRNAITWQERLAYDVIYVQKISFWLDLRIFWQTLLVVVSRRGLYADQSNPQQLQSEPLNDGRDD